MIHKRKGTTASAAPRRRLGLGLAVLCWLSPTAASQPENPVYVDDSAVVAALDTGCTLSFSPLNGAAADNPLAGYVFWCQDEYADSGVGGPNATQQIDQPAAPNTSERLTLCVMQVNDAGRAGLD